MECVQCVHTNCRPWDTVAGDREKESEREIKKKTYSNI